VHADAIMSNVDALDDCGRAATLPLRLGVNDAFRPRSGRGRRGDHVLYVGRLSREKGVLDLLDAAARSRDPWPLRIVGSGPLENALRHRAQRLGIEHRVSFRPFIRDPEHLARAYATARCVVLPGVHETFGLVALEAAATGARVVTCRTAPAAAAVAPLAHVFDPGDEPGLDAAIAAARAAEPDTAAAGALAWRSRWPRVSAEELAAMRRLVG
jgi:alpha-1,6-mannosyltransferase